MISLEYGSIFDADVDAIVNPVNCVGAMGKGLALEFKKRYPAYFLNYQSACKANELAPGKLLIYPNEKPLFIISFPTKIHWKNKSEYGFIVEGLFQLYKMCFNNPIKSIAIPALGCGLGGLEWKVIEEMITITFESTDIDVKIFPPK